MSVSQRGQKLGVDVADRLEALGRQPAPVGVEHDVDGCCGPAGTAVVEGADQALGDEERHLGVVGEETVLEIFRAVGAELALDLGEGGELDRRAEGVADGAGKEAAAEAGEQWMVRSNGAPFVNFQF